MMANSFTLLPLPAYLILTMLVSLLGSLAFVDDASLFQQVPVIGGYLSYASANWRFAMQFSFWFLAAGHFAEAVYAAYLARSAKMSVGDTIKWVMQTVFLGVLSLIALKKMCKETKKSS